MRLRNAAGTVVSVSGALADKYQARGWQPVSGRASTPAVAEPKGTAEGAGSPPVESDVAPPGVVTLSSVRVPDGTAKDVLDWVGDDRERARQALDVERGKGDEARSTLVAKLSKLAE